MEQPDPPERFAARVALLQSEIHSILTSEMESGELQFSDEGIDSTAGGAWKASIRRVELNGNVLDIECREVRDDAWRVMVIPKRPIWPARFLDWPTEDFEAQLRDAVATLRSSENRGGELPADL
jgi:hypothetical protein